MKSGHDQRRPLARRSPRRRAQGVGVPDVVRQLCFTGAGEPRKSLSTKAVDPAVAEWLIAEQDRIHQALTRARSARVAQDTVMVLALAAVYAREYEKAKADRRALDFADLVDRARALVEHRPDAAWVLYKLDGGIDHILVDEAQDTAPEQWDILNRLTAEFFAGEGLPPGSQLDRSLFVVGDVKQSIYSFQGADPDRLLLETQRYDTLIRASGRVPVGPTLDVSFRSTNQVLTFVDTVFVAPQTRRGVPPPRGEDIIVHEPFRDHDGCVDLWPLEREDPSEDRGAWSDPLDASAETSANHRLAVKIADEIEALVRRGDAVFDKDAGAWRPARYGDVLILVRRRKALFEEILRKLKQRGVPVAEVRLREQLALQPGQGELLLSRELREVSQNHDAQAVVVGTYAVSGAMVYVSLKLVSPQGNQVVAATDYALPVDENLRGLLQGR